MGPCGGRGGRVLTTADGASPTDLVQEVENGDAHAAAVLGRQRHRQQDEADEGDGEDCSEEDRPRLAVHPASQGRVLELHLLHAAAVHAHRPGHPSACVCVCVRLCLCMCARVCRSNGFEMGCVHVCVVCMCLRRAD